MKRGVVRTACKRRGNAGAGEIMLVWYEYKIVVVAMGEADEEGVCLG